ncbi:unnamed protein product [Closterium sp. NIES-64]|nr:unnamed protein product [Closterium sp. NIES-65]CAI5999121.1 unnamed protein product [Closterium sp. NIES-64]
MASVKPPSAAGTARATANPGAAETASASQYTEFKAQTWYDVQRNAPAGSSSDLRGGAGAGAGAGGAEGRAAAEGFSAEAVLRQAEQQAAERRRGARLRAAPPVYFFPRRSWGVTIAKYGAVVAAGLAAGMALETWIRQKVAEDGGYVMGKKGAAKH